MDKHPIVRRGARGHCSPNRFNTFLSEAIRLNGVNNHCLVLRVSRSRRDLSRLTDTICPLSSVYFAEVVARPECHNLLLVVRHAFCPLNRLTCSHLTAVASL